MPRSWAAPGKSWVGRAPAPSSPTLPFPTPPCPPWTRVACQDLPRARPDLLLRPQPGLPVLEAGGGPACLGPHAAGPTEHCGAGGECRHRHAVSTARGQRGPGGGKRAAGGSASRGPPSSSLRLARMAEEMREAEAPAGQPGPLAGSSPTELQYRRCIQEFISLHLDES